MRCFTNALVAVGGLLASMLPLAASPDRWTQEGLKADFEQGGYRVVWKEGVSSAHDAARIENGRDVGTVIVTRNGGDVVHDETFAFVAQAFHPDIAIETE